MVNRFQLANFKYDIRGYVLKHGPSRVGLSEVMSVSFDVRMLISKFEM